MLPAATFNGTLTDSNRIELYLALVPGKKKINTSREESIES